MRRHIYFGLVCGLLGLCAAGELAAQSDAGTDWMRQADDPRRLGQQLLKEGNLEQAKEVLERAEVQYPGDTNVLRGLAEVYYRLGKQRFDAGSSVEGVYFYERALQKDRMFPLTWVGLGESRYAEGDLNGAVDALQQAETLNAQGARELMARVRTTRATVPLGVGPKWRSHPPPHVRVSSRAPHKGATSRRLPSMLRGTPGPSSASRSQSLQVTCLCIWSSPSQ